MICGDDDENTPTTKPDPAPVPKAPERRALVTTAAVNEIGNGDPKKYWDDVLPGVNVGHADWCGAGALWSLHQAGLALDRKWTIEKGFILVGPHPLPPTKTPLPGDIAYFQHNQHQAVVVGVEGDLVQLVNFNGAAGKVSPSTIHKSQATLFYSIEPLLHVPTGNA